MTLPSGTSQFAVLDLTHFGRQSFCFLLETMPGTWQQWLLVKSPPLKAGVTRICVRRSDVQLSDVPITPWDSGPCSIDAMGTDTYRIQFGGRRMFGDYTFIEPRPNHGLLLQGKNAVADGRFALSAGGIVVQPGASVEAATIILIRPRGRNYWTLPKGTVESNESVDEAAIREVEEETGVYGSIVAPLDPIEYWFWSHEGSERIRIHKSVAYYLMTAQREGQPTATKEIDETRWFTLDEAPGMLSHDSERDVLIQGIAAWRELAPQLA